MLNETDKDSQAQQPEQKTEAKKTEAKKKEKKEKLSLGERLLKLEHEVAMAAQTGQDWLEVEEDVLMNINPQKGQLPQSGFISYKNVNVCLKGKMEENLRKMNLSSYELTFGGSKEGMSVR